jgi:hypothetical protein
MADNRKLHRVLAPYVTLKLRDANGAWVLQGFYKDAVLDYDLEEETLKRHIDEGMVAEVGEPTPAIDPDKVRDGEMVVGSPGGPVLTDMAQHPVTDSPALSDRPKPAPPKK